MLTDDGLIELGEARSDIPVVGVHDGDRLYYRYVPWGETFDTYGYVDLECPAGDAAAGLCLLQEEADEHVRAQHPEQLDAHLTPTPRIEAGQIARGSGSVHAAIDLSDGLSGDLGHLCRQGGVGAEVDPSLLPVSSGARAVADRYGRDVTEWATAGGEDYELLLAVAPGDVEGLRKALEDTGLRATAVGRVTSEGSAVRARMDDGRGQTMGTAFDHFRS